MTLFFYTFTEIIREPYLYDCNRWWYCWGVQINTSNFGDCIILLCDCIAWFELPPLIYCVQHPVLLGPSYVILNKVDRTHATSFLGVWPSLITEHYSDYMILISSPLVCHASIKHSNDSHVLMITYDRQ